MRRRAALAIGAALACGVARGQTPNFGPVTILVGFSAGQTADSPNDSGRAATQPLSAEPAFDQSARLYAAHLPRFLPGTPKVDVRLAPGAGGLVAARRMLDARSDNGATLALLGPQPYFSALTGAAAGFDPAALAWIGARTREDDACLARADGPLGTIHDARDREAFAAALTPDSRSFLYPRALNVLAGTQFRIISGYSSGFEIQRVFETREADVWCGWSIQSIRARHADLLREGKAKLLVQFTAAQSLQIPRAIALAQGEARDALEALERLTLFQGFALATAASAGAQKIETLRGAFTAMLHDGEFLAAAGKQGADIDPVTGEALQRQADELTRVSAPARALLRSVARPD